MRTVLNFVILSVFAVIVVGGIHLFAAEAAKAKAEAKPAAVPADAKAAPAGGQNAPAAPAVNGKEELTIDWMAEIIKGGMTSLALVLLSAAAVGFAAERFFNLRAKHLAPGYYLNFFKSKAAAGEWQAIRDEAAQRPSIVAALGAYLAQHRGRPHALLAEDLADIAGREFERHRQRSYPLAIIATMAPMLGLLGTMIGMIEAFQKVAILGDTGDASVLADSIGKALITTAVGLILAIPALGCYHYLKTKIALAELKVEEAAGAMLRAVESRAAGEKNA